MNNNNISVIIPHYNRKMPLENALASIFSQTLRPSQIIVVDDGSNEVPELPENVTLIVHDTNKGAAAARNTGVSAATGNYIAFLDSDDTWLPDKLEKQLTHMKDAGSRLSSTHALFGAARRPLSNKHLTKAAIIGGQGVNFGSCVMMEKTLWHDIGELDENLRRLEDYEWLVRAAIRGITPTVTDCYGSIINVGAAPAKQAVIKSASIISNKYKNGRITAACAIECAAACVWQKDFLGFIKYLIKAAFYNAPLVVHFILTRIKRLTKGDAPRFFSLPY